MKNNFIRIVKMTAYYSFLGLILQGLLVNFLFAITPAEGQNLRDVKVSVNVVNVSLEEALQMIEQKSNFKFIFFEEGLPLKEKATVIVDDESLYNILEVFAKDYGLTFNRINDQIVVKKNVDKTENLVTAVETGTIKGKVTDASTKEGLIGASVLLRGTQQGASTDTKGNYTIENVKPGRYTLAVSYIGYATMSKVIVVSADKTEDVNFDVKQSTVDLDEVVINGAFSQTEKRTASNPVTLLTSKAVDALPTTNIYDLFQSKVPGFFNTTGGEGASNVLSNGFRGIASFNFKNINYYIDGIPVEQSLGKNQLITDLNNIDKIEILKGPMATTLYGSRASNGVVNITTKGSSGGKLSVSLKAAVTSKEAQYATESGLMDYEQSLNVSGGTNQLGYSFGLTHFDNKLVYAAVKPRSSTWQFNAGVRANFDPFLVDAKISYIRATDPFQVGPLPSVAKIEGWDKWRASNSIPNYNFEYSNFNTSISIKQVLNSNWYHNLTLGYTNFSYYQMDLSPQTTSTQTWLSLFSYTPKLTLRYIMNYNSPIGEDFTADLTGGFEYYFRTTDVVNYNLDQTMEQELQLSRSPVGSSVGHGWESNYGYFAQGIFGYANKLFLTVGLRLEQNTGFADAAGVQTLPRIGLSYVAELGDLTIKPRISYGSNVNPPTAAQVYGQMLNSTFIFAANPNLVPEKVSGYEFGADIYYGNLLSLDVTYFNQTADNLITIQLLSVSPILTYQYTNLAKTYAKGIEIGGSINLNPFTVNLTFASLKNTAGPGNEASGYKEGDKLSFASDGNWTAELNYKFGTLFSTAGKGGSVAVRANYSGSVRTLDYLNYYRGAYKTGAPSKSLTIANAIDTDTYTLLGVTADYWFLDNLNVYVDIKNLLNKQDVWIYAAPLIGRHSTIGVKYNF